MRGRISIYLLAEAIRGHDINLQYSTGGIGPSVLEYDIFRGNRSIVFLYYRTIVLNVPLRQKIRVELDFYRL